MDEVGIRALQQNASAVVARAESGELVTITDRGRRVAQLGPLNTGRLEALVAAGQARPARRDLKDLPGPTRRRRDQRPLSEILEEDRVSNRS